MGGRLVIVGAGGHAKVVVDVALANGLSIMGFLDDLAIVAPFPQYEVLGTVSCVDELMRLHADAEVFIGIGENHVRREIAVARLTSHRIAEPLIHPYGYVSPETKIGRGTILMPGVVVNAGTRIGTHAILNTSCSVDHDCCIGDYAHISPGVHLAGTVTIGEGCHVGIGASILPGVSIGDWAVVGAGAVVTHDVPARCVAVGVPARVAKTLES